MMEGSHSLIFVLCNRDQLLKINAPAVLEGGGRVAQINPGKTRIGIKPVLIALN